MSADERKSMDKENDILSSKATLINLPTAACAEKLGIPNLYTNVTFAMYCMLFFIFTW